MGSMRDMDKEFDPKEIEQMLPEQFDTLFERMPLTEDTTCGYWIFKGPLLQKMASKKVYVILYGLIGCLLGATFAYFSATISTLEKLFKIPSRNTGIISVGNDIASLLCSSILGYYCGSGHRPRWIAFGILTFAIFCFMNALPHFIYGPGDDALEVTLEYGRIAANRTLAVVEAEKRKSLCRTDGAGESSCEQNSGNIAAQIILFVAQLICGIGQSLFYSLGTTYMDDNVLKSKTASFISLSYFLRLCGPAIGYTLASKVLSIYIEPSLTPTITTADPRWLGAWWIGWLALGVPILISSGIFALFPKTLPRAAVRKAIHKERLRRDLSVAETEVEKPSLKGMLITFKRLLGNRVYMYSTISGVFYIFGYQPYWMYSAKYMEIQYRLTASTSSMILGIVTMCFSAMGILMAGWAISRYKPNARIMAAWNVIVGFITVAGMLSYAFMGCAENEQSFSLGSDSLNVTSCNGNCHCDYVKYSPVCGDDGKTYISACHAGCTDQVLVDGEKLFTNCSCSMLTEPSGLTTKLNLLSNPPSNAHTSNAKPGPCPVNCYSSVIPFVAVMCLLKFSGATARAAGFLLSIRCVDEKDKTVSLGFGQMIMSIFTFVPSPIFFGYLMDSTCLVWGKTCTGTGNCWLYDSETLRWSQNTITASCMAVSIVFDIGVWLNVKKLQMFDEEDETTSAGNGIGTKTDGLSKSTKDSNAPEIILASRLEHRGSIDL